MDCSGQDTIEERQSSGVRATIDKLLGGDGHIEKILFRPETPPPSTRKVEGFAYLPGEKVLELALEERHKGFTEVAIGFDPEHAQKKALPRFAVRPEITNPRDFLPRNIIEVE